jgi:hypothetical protein
VWVDWVTGLRGEHTELEIKMLKANWSRSGWAGSVEGRVGRHGHRQAFVYIFTERRILYGQPILL